MIALPVMRGRGATVLNWCCRMQIFLEEPSHEGMAQELLLPHLEADQRLMVLCDKGINTSICEVLSAIVKG